MPENVAHLAQHLSDKRLKKETQPSTAVLDSVHPVENGLVRTFTYDTNRWMTGETWLTNNIQVAVWSNAYDDAGNRVYARDPLGAVTRTLYNANNLPVLISNALQQVTTMQYDGGGNLIRSVNPRSAETLWAYDARGLSTNTTLPDGTAYEMTYDSIGRLTDVTDPVGLTVSNVYDNLDRVSDVYYQDATHTHYNFSCCGLDSVVDRLGKQTTYQRDILGRVTNVLDAANQRVGFGYGPGGEITNLTVWITGLPRRTYFSYTSTNGYTRLTQRKSPLGKTTGYDYYFRGWLKSRTDGANRVTQYQYDVLGRLKEINYPGGTNVTMGYDAVGHVTSLANNNGSSTFAYDILGRLMNSTVSLAVPGMTAVQYALEYQYDAAGNVTNRTLRGLSGFTQVISTRYDYDLMNRLTLVTNALAYASYSYDRGRLATKLYGNGDWVSYQYDLESRLTNLAIWGSGLMLQQFGYTYDAMGMMRSQESKSLLGAGYSNQRIDYGYDAVYQLTSEVVRVNGGAAVTNRWTYDTAGNVKTASGPFGQATAIVNADSELTRWTQGVQQITATGQVDPGANSNNWFASTASAQGHSAPVSMQDGSFGIVGVPVNAGANVLTAIVQDVSGNTATQTATFSVVSPPSTTFSYDANGNMTNSSAGVSPASVYSYDAENRPTTVTSNGVTELQCWYDGAGHRIAKREIVNGQTNTFQYVWDGWNLVAVLGEDGTLKEYYTRGVGIAGDIGTLVAVTQYSGGSPIASYHLHNNHRGDVIMARQGTNTLATLDYAPYGELRSQAGSYAPRFCFSSKEYDGVTGLYHFPYRYYAPQWARWMTRDLVDERRESNLYSYVMGNPDNYFDPDGRGPVEIPIPGWPPSFPKPKFKFPPVGWPKLPSIPCFDAMNYALSLFKDLKSGLFTGKDADKLAHCMAHCELKKGCGSLISNLLGYGKEIADQFGYLLGKCDQGFDPEDIAANKKGYEIADSGKDCEEGCKGAYPNAKY
jgi:RHS repeat-associated protein